MLVKSTSASLYNFIVFFFKKILVNKCIIKVDYFKFNQAISHFKQATLMMYFHQKNSTGRILPDGQILPGGPILLGGQILPGICTRIVQGHDWYCAHTKVQKQVEFYQVFVQELYKAVIGTVPIPKSKSRSNSTRWLNSTGWSNSNI